MQRGRPRDPAATPDESGAVGLVFSGVAKPAGAAEHVNHVQPAGSAARPPDAHQRVAFGHGNRFDEQVAERGVGEVRVAGGQHYLGIAGEIETACVAAVIGH